MAAKKIALLANGISVNDPEALEVLLRAKGLEVDLFDVRSMQQTGAGFEIDDDGATRKVDAAGYAFVMRIIKGGVSGDTAKSWALQKLFEDAGATPHISVEAAEKITNKILCQKVLADKNISSFAMATVESADKRAITTNEIEALGQPPYVVRKNVGSGKDSLAIVASPEEALHAAEQYRNPLGDNAVKSGVIIH